MSCYTHVLCLPPKTNKCLVTMVTTNNHVHLNCYNTQVLLFPNFHIVVQHFWKLDNESQVTHHFDKFLTPTLHRCMLTFLEIWQ